MFAYVTDRNRDTPPYIGAKATGQGRGQAWAEQTLPWAGRDAGKMIQLVALTQAWAGNS